MIFCVCVCALVRFTLSLECSFHLHEHAYTNTLTIIDIYNVADDGRRRRKEWKEYADIYSF